MYLILHIWEVFFGSFLVWLLSLFTIILSYPISIYEDALKKHDEETEKYSPLWLIFPTIGLHIGRSKRFKNYNFKSKVPHWLFLLCWLNLISMLTTLIFFITATYLETIS